MIFPLLRAGSGFAPTAPPAVTTGLSPSSRDFPRVKIGVGAKPNPEMELADWVLSTFSANEEKLLQPALERAADAALCILAKGVPEAANRYNGSQS